MYYDLNVPWPSQFRAAGPSHKGPRRKDKKDGPVTQTPVKYAPDAPEGMSLIQREKMRAVTVDLGELGYGTVAYNHIVESKFDPARHKNPFASPLQPTQSLPPFPELDPEHASPTQRETVQIRQLSRMTLILDEDSVGKGGHGMTAPSSASLLSYDLLAAQPFNDASFSLLCLTLSELKPNSVDIISLDLSSSARLPFFLKRSTVNAALANGVVFEICYSKVVSRGDGEDQSRIRRNIISAARDILRITDGKGVIFSSGAADVLGLRGPQDVMNLAAIFGLNQTAARDAIASTCRSLVLRAETRKTFRAVVAHPTVATVKTPSDIPGSVAENSGKRKQEEGNADVPAKRVKAAGA